jgi:hypothetical protein
MMRGLAAILCAPALSVARGTQEVGADMPRSRTAQLADKPREGGSRPKVQTVVAMLIAKFQGDVQELTAAYDRAHALIMSRGGAVPSGELRHQCATGNDSLYIIGVWESEDHIRRRWSSDEFKQTLGSVGFPSPEQAEMTILHLHAIEPPL